MDNLLGMRVYRFNVSAWLAKNIGGTWRYDNHGSWWCDVNQDILHIRCVNCLVGFHNHIRFGAFIGIASYVTVTGRLF